MYHIFCYFIYILSYLSVCTIALEKVPTPTFGRVHLHRWKSSQNLKTQPYIISCRRNCFEPHCGKTQKQKQNQKSKTKHCFSPHGTFILVGETNSQYINIQVNIYLQTVTSRKEKQMLPWKKNLRGIN